MMADKAFYGQTILSVIFVVELICLLLRQRKMVFEILVYPNETGFRRLTLRTIYL